jgi:putative hydrolase of the HAD superfamily
LVDRCSKSGKNIHECFYVGDRMDTDAIGSKRAGMIGIWLNRKGELIPDDVRTEIMVIETLGELRGKLNSQFFSER